MVNNISANWSVDNASVLTPWHHLRKPWTRSRLSFCLTQTTLKTWQVFRMKMDGTRLKQIEKCQKKNRRNLCRNELIEEVDRRWFCIHVLPLWRQLSRPILPLSLFPTLPSKGVKASSQRLSWASRDSNGMVIATELLVKFTNLAPRKSWVNEKKVMRLFVQPNHLGFKCCFPCCI